MLAIVLLSVCVVILCPLVECKGIPPKSNPSTPSSPSSVVRIALVHRHGMRTPKTKIADEASALTEDGKIMLIQLGKAIRERYDTVIDRSFSTATSTIRSSFLPRCRESAAAAASGVFVDPLDVPLVNYVPPSQDYLLQTLTWPSNILRGNSFALERTTAEAHRLFTPDNITRLAQGLGKQLGSLCTTDLAKCVVLAQDTAMCGLTARVPDPPCDPYLCRTVLPQLNRLRGVYAHYSYAYSGDAWYQKQIGSYGNLLAQDISKSLLKGKQRTFFQYSTQQHTMVGLYATLGLLQEGDVDSMFNLPVFGEAIIFELDGAGNVRALRGVPVKEKGYTYTFADMPLRCGAEGKLTTRPCPLSQWKQYLDSKGPTSSNPVCVAHNVTLKAAGCDVLNVPVAPGSTCARYRSQCPAEACPFGTVLDRKLGLACVTTDEMGEYGVSHSTYHTVVGILSFIIVVQVAYILKLRYTQKLSKN